MTTVPLFDHFTGADAATDNAAGTDTAAVNVLAAGAAPHGVDALLVRAGTALTAWGERSAARRSAPQLLRLQAQSDYAENRTTLMALGNSLLLR